MSAAHAGSAADTRAFVHINCIIQSGAHHAGHHRAVVSANLHAGCDALGKAYRICAFVIAVGASLHGVRFDQSTGVSHALCSAFNQLVYRQPDLQPAHVPADLHSAASLVRNNCVNLFPGMA